MRSFEFHVGGIEDGIIAALRAAVGTGAPAGYAKTIASYGGQLDADHLKKALSDITPMMPLFLVGYGDGEDVQSPATAPVPPTLPRYFRHDCTFTVFCCTDDARGEKARRRGKTGVYRMISDAWETLGGLQFVALDGQEQVVLNPEPLRPAGVDYIARLPNLTAYAVHFDTWFKHATPDRSVTGPLVQELIFDVENQYQKGEPPNLPGVILD